MRAQVSQIASRAASLKAAKKTLPFILFALAMLSLAGCGAAVGGVSLVNGTTIGLGGAAAGIYGTKPDEGQPVDTSLQMSQHESWCYQTAGYPECYAYPQKDANSRLINVDPPNRYPMTARAYHEAVIESQQ